MARWSLQAPTADFIGTGTALLAQTMAECTPYAQRCSARRADLQVAVWRSQVQVDLPSVLQVAAQGLTCHTTAGCCS